jgi:hypothetical protein
MELDAVPHSDSVFRCGRLVRMFRSDMSMVLFQPGSTSYLLHGGFFLGLSFNPEVGGHMFL